MPLINSMYLENPMDRTSVHVQGLDPVDLHIYRYIHACMHHIHSSFDH